MTTVLARTNPVCLTDLAKIAFPHLSYFDEICHRGAMNFRLFRSESPKSATLAEIAISVQHRVNCVNRPVTL